MMPQMNGFETISAIKELTTTINSLIIIFSNINNKTDIDK
jgi:CheY-like chemotaxis protein